MKNFFYALTMLLFTSLLPAAAWAQLQVTGKVTDAATGEPLPGVSITVQGTTIGAQTDLDGNYEVNVPDNESILDFRFLGYASQTVTASQNILNVQLEMDTEALNEVVVTALGIERETKTVPYAVQSIGADKLGTARETDLNTAIAGKIAGVQILGQSGAKLGEGTAIRIRGAGSFTDRSPLYVVDGTPVDILDLNMDDVESVSVLKGPAATAIYGQRGDAGVVIVTTKTGKNKPGIGIDINQTTTIDVVGLLPEYQNVYGGGGSSEWLTYTWQPGHPEGWKALDGKKFHDYTDDASWGPKMDGSEYIPWYAWYPNTPHSFKTTSFTPQPDNIKGFYDKGVTLNNNVSFSKAAEDYNLRLSYTNLSQTGILPGSDLNRNYLSAKINYDLNDHFSISANINFTNEKLEGIFEDGYGAQGASGSFNSWFHRDLDFDMMKEFAGYKSPQNTLVSWNHENPGSTDPAEIKQVYQGNYWYNFYNWFDNIENINNRSRLFGNIGLTYKLNDHFQIAGFVRRNSRNRNWEYKTYNILEQSAYQTGVRNYYETGQVDEHENNYELLATYDNRFGDFSIELNGGGNIRYNFYRSVDNNTDGGLVVPDLFTIPNSRTPTTLANYREYKKVRSLYAHGSVGYGDFIYLDFSGRNDWSSALPVDNNSYFYPSVGLSFVFSELLSSSMPALSYGKLRASWAQVGSDLDPYRTALLYGIGSNQFDGNILTGVPDELANVNIKPALSTAREIGLDLDFLRNRVGMSFTYYQQDRKDEILGISISGASGFSRKLINAGHIQSSGVELELHGTPVETADFTWEATLNLAKTKSKVIELAEGIDSYAYGTGGAVAFGFVSIVHEVGEEWGQLRGTAFKRMNGQPVLDENGFYVSELNHNYGTVLPDFTGGLYNTFTYKDLALSFLIDFQKGGKFYSLSEHWGNYSGLYAATAETNDNGVNVREPVDEGGGVKVTGVDEAGNPVTHYVDAQDYYRQYYSDRIAEQYVHDADFIKFRQLKLSYRLPIKKWLPNSNTIQSLNVGVVARNLWLISAAKDNPFWDPSEISGRFGENAQLPPTRSIGFDISLGF